METELLDSSHGWEFTNTFLLEQYWMVWDPEDEDVGADVVRISVQYSTAGIDHSGAELVLLENEARHHESLLRLKSFAGQWWSKLLNVTPGAPLEEAPEELSDVAAELLERFVHMKEVTGN